MLAEDAFAEIVVAETVYAFSGYEVRSALVDSLRGVVAQTLCKKIDGGRVAALEILLVTPAVSNLIREGKTNQITGITQASKAQGMALLNDEVGKLVEARKITMEEALSKAVDKEAAPASASWR